MRYLFAFLNSEPMNLHFLRFFKTLSINTRDRSRLASLSLLFPINVKILRDSRHVARARSHFLERKK